MLPTPLASTLLTGTSQARCGRAIASFCSMSAQITRRGWRFWPGCDTPFGEVPSSAQAVAMASCSATTGTMPKSAGICTAWLPSIATTPFMLMRTSARPSMTGRPRKY